MKAICGACVFAVMSVFAGSVQAQEKLTANTLRLAPGQNPPPATLQDMAWYAGHWTGGGLDGFNEEIWSEPRGGAMMGMYRLVKDGKPAFYELLTLVEEKGTLVLKLKHFHPDLRGWEERDESEQFVFVAKRDGRIYFDGMTFEPDGPAERPSSVKVYLVIKSRDGAIREEVFRYVRVAAAGGG